MRCPWVSYSLHHHHIKVWAGLVTERTYHFERGKEWKHWKRLNRKIRTWFLFVLFCFLNVERVKKNRSSLSLDLLSFFFLSLYKISIYCHYYSAFLVHISLYSELCMWQIKDLGSWILSCLKHLIEVASLIDPFYHLDFSNYREASFWTKKKVFKGALGGSKGGINSQTPPESSVILVVITLWWF